MTEASFLYSLQFSGNLFKLRIILSFYVSFDKLRACSWYPEPFDKLRTSRDYLSKGTTGSLRQAQ